MVNFLKTPNYKSGTKTGSVGGGDRFADVLRQQLAESAAQRFMQSKYPQQQESPQFDYAGTLFPAAFQAAQGAIGLKQQEQQQQQMMEQQGQQAQLLAQQLDIPLDQAMQIASAPPQLQKQMIDGIMKEREGAVSFERSQALEEQKQQGRLSLEQEKMRNKLEIERFTKGLDKVSSPERKQFEQMFKTYGTLGKIKVGYEEPGLIPGYSERVRPKEELVGSLMNTLVSNQAKLLGIDSDERKRLYDQYMTMYYKDPKSRLELMNKIRYDMDPELLEEFRQLVQQPQESIPDQATIDQAMQLGMEGQQQFNPNIIEEGAQQEDRRGSFLGRKLASAGIGLASGVPGLAGDIPQIIQSVAGSGAMNKVAPLLEEDNAKFEAMIANETPRYQELLRQERDQMTPERRARIMEEFDPQRRVTPFPTGSDIRKKLIEQLPKDYLSNPDLLDAGIEALGREFPFIALAGATGGASSAIRPVVRSVFGGATQEAMQRAGYGPMAQFLGTLGAGMLVDKGFRTYAEGSLQSRQTSDLKPIVDEMYDAARTKGANTQVPLDAFKKRYEPLFAAIDTPASGLTREASSDVKHALKNFEGFANVDSVPFTDLIEAQKGLNETIQGLDKSAASKLSLLNKGINESLALIPDAPGVREYNIGKNLYGALNNMNRVEKFIYDMNKLSAGSKIGGTLATGWIASLLGIPKAKLIGGGIGTVLAGSSAMRQLRNLSNIPQARTLAMNAVKEVIAGNTAKGQRNWLNLVKIANKVAKEDKED